MWYYTIEEWNLMSLEERVDAAYDFYTTLQPTIENYVETQAILTLLQNLRGT